MASPIMLMGALEIYMKDGLFRKVGDDDIKKPDKTYLLDRCVYTDRAGQERCYNELFDMVDTDSNDVTTMPEGSHVTLDWTNDSCIMRQIQSIDVDSYTVSYNSDSKQVLVTTSNTALRPPAVYSQIYALFNHGSSNGARTAADVTNRAISISHATGNVLSMRINGEVLEKYRDEVDKLCVFISPVISPYKHTDSAGIVMRSTYKSQPTKENAFFFCEKLCSGSYNMHKSGCAGSFLPEMKSADEIRKSIQDIAGLYTNAQLTFDVETLEKDKWIDVNLSGGMLQSDRLVQHDDTMIKTSDMMPVSIVTGHIFGYNERLHVFNFQKKEVYRLPYSSLAYNNGAGQYKAYDTNHVPYEYAIEIRDSKDSLVISHFTCESPAINPLVAYGDTDTKSIRIVKRFQKGNKLYAGYKDFTPIPFAGVACGYISTTLKPIDIAVEEVSLRDYTNAFREEKIEADSNEYGKNEIRVSEFGSVLFEPSKSYRVGNGTIIALARLSMGLSQDNCGKFPLVIFSTDGIYTLGVDTSGEGAYAQQPPPISRVICTNKNGICELDGAVLFPSEYGLHMVTTDGVKPIVLQANGTPKNLPDSEAGLDVYKRAISHDKIVQLSGDISYEDFLDYINADGGGETGEGTYIRYLHAINSVVIYNRRKPYSYMVELGSWLVTKLEQRILFDDNDFPKQTFWVSPQLEGTVSVEQDVYNAATGETEKRWVSLADAVKSINGMQLLIQKLINEIIQSLNDKLARTNDNIGISEDALTANRAVEVLQSGYDESVFAADGTTKAIALAGLADEYTALTDNLAELRSTHAKIVAAQAVDLSADYISDEDESKLTAVGLKSVSAMLRGINIKEVIEQLVQEEAAKRYGLVDSNLLFEHFGSGKLILEKQGDLWVKGERAYTDVQLSGIGLQVATEAESGMRYRIETKPTNAIAVQFDYNTEDKGVQVLLQTRPISLETPFLKSFYRIVLRGAFEKSDDITVTSEKKNKFLITDRITLSKYCDGKDVVLYYRKHAVVTNSGNTTTTIYKWQWETKDGEAVVLKNIGLAQASSISSEDTITIAVHEHYAGLYIFGSLDGNHWDFLEGKERLLSNHRFHDIGVETHRVSYRYIMVVFAATLSQDSHIDGLEMTSNVKYSNKLK